MAKSSQEQRRGVPTSPTQERPTKARSKRRHHVIHKVGNAVGTSPARVITGCLSARGMAHLLLHGFAIESALAVAYDLRGVIREREKRERERESRSHVLKSGWVVTSSSSLTRMEVRCGSPSWTSCSSFLGPCLGMQTHAAVVDGVAESPPFAFQFPALS